MTRAALLYLLVITAAAQAAPLTVTVTDIDGNPAQGADVYCVRWHDHGCRTEPLPTESHQTTGENGQAQFDVDGIQQFILYARQGRFAAYDRFHPNQNPDGGAAMLQLQYSRHVTGVISDQQGQPLEDVQIMALSTIPLGETDADGRYSIYGMGRYDLADTWLYKAGYIATPFSFAFNFGVYDIILSKGLPILGEVVWSDGAPAQNVEVKTAYFAVTTDDEGLFQFPPQKYMRRLQLQGIVRREQFGSVLAEIDILAPFDEHYVLQLPLTEHAALVENAAVPTVRAYVSGTVTTKDGKPERADILRKRVGAIDNDLGLTDENGRFRLPLPHFEGAFELVARPLNVTLCMLGQSIKVQANPQRDAEAHFTIVEGAYIAGKVLDSAGNPMPNEAISFMIGPDDLRSAQSSQQGSFAFPNLPITGKPLVIEKKFRGHPRTRVEIPALQPGERRRDIVIAPPPSNEAKRDHPAFSAQVVFAMQRENSGESLPRLQFAQATADTLPETSEPSYVPVRVLVLDENGDPVPNVLLLTTEPKFIGSSCEHGEIVFYHDWVGPVTWQVGTAEARHALFIDEYSTSLNNSQQVTVLSGSLSAEAPEDLLDLRVTIQRPQWTATWGKIVLEDSAGTPNASNADVIVNDKKSRDDLSMRDTWFLTTKLPIEPHLLEFTADGYQPRVLASGIDYNTGDGPIIVTLARGPMPKDKSAWTVVTGQPATQEAVDAFPSGNYVRSNERRYRQIAGVPPKPDPMRAFLDTGAIPPDPALAQLPPPPYRIRVVDENGEPLDAVYYQNPNAGFGAFSLEEPLPPRRDQPYEFLRGEDGWFEFPMSGITIWADSMGFALFPSLIFHPTVPEQIVLTKATSITIKVRDWNGNPVSNARVGDFRFFHRQQNFGDAGLIKTTGEDGMAVFENWSAGRHRFAVESDRSYLFEVATEPGGSVAREVMIGPWPPGTPPFILEQWRQLSHLWTVHEQPSAIPHPMIAEQREQARTEREALITALSASDRESIAREVVRQISDSPMETVWRQHHKMAFLAGVAKVLDIHDAIAPLKRWLAGYITGFPHQSGSTGSWTDRARLESLQHVAAAIIALDNDNSVEFFADLAANEDADPTSRAAAIVALGIIGTPEAINLWRELRNDAFENSDAITPKDAYTHEERMTEALIATLYVIPLTGHDAEHPLNILTTHNATVDANYEFGSLHLGDAFSGGTQFVLRRFGDEWLIVWVGSTFIS